MTSLVIPSGIRCGQCGGDRFVECVDVYGLHYVGCVRCVIIPDPRPEISATSVHLLMETLSAKETELRALISSEWTAQVSFLLGECYAARALRAPPLPVPVAKKRRKAAKVKTRRRTR